MNRIVNLPPSEALLPDGARVGGWWHELEDGSQQDGAQQDGTRIVCDLCPRNCTLKPGDRGFCFVRENRDGQMVLTT
jgi:pyruvate formate lyase activating enzyme